jgi:hypothetical protein
MNRDDPDQVNRMAPGTLLGYKRAAPFRPFRIVLNSGRHYDVYHPDFIAVGHVDAVYFFQQTSESPHDRWETFSLELIDHIEHLPSQAAAPRTS